MVNQEQIKQDLARLRDTIDKAGDALHLPQLREELTELKEEMNTPDFWNNLERSTVVNRKVSQIENKLNHVAGLKSRADDVEAMLELLAEDEDEAIAQECEDELAALSAAADELELEPLLRGESDHCSASRMATRRASSPSPSRWTAKTPTASCAPSAACTAWCASPPSMPTHAATPPFPRWMSPP